MATLIIRNVPEKTCSTLKRRAAKHHRSMAMEALTLLEEKLYEFEVPAVNLEGFTQIRFKKKVNATPEWVERMINEGRD